MKSGTRLGSVIMVRLPVCWACFGTRNMDSKQGRVDVGHKFPTDARMLIIHIPPLLFGSSPADLERVDDRRTGIK